MEIGAKGSAIGAFRLRRHLRSVRQGALEESFA